MGKYERRDIELMEKNVVRVLMSKKPLITPAHKWYGHMLGFVKFIKKTYPSFKKVQHIGNKYSGLRGDIKIYKKSGAVEYIELKASETEFGRGTLANISQNAVTEYGLIINKEEEEILSWSELRKTKKFRDRVESFLNTFKYPRKVDFYDKARVIRKMAKKGNLRAMAIKRLISKLAKKDKKEYINHIRQFQVNEENLKKFLFCMLNGIHVKKDISNFMAKIKVGNLRKSSALTTTLYGNVKKGKIVVTREKNKIGILLNRYENFKFSFPEETGDTIYTYVSCNRKGKNKRDIKILGLVYHWKNIFQGIKTPCINVFLGPDYQSI